MTAENLDRTLKSGSGDHLSGDLGEIFGIDLDKGGDKGLGEAELKQKARKGTTSLTADKGVEQPRPQATSKAPKASSRLAAPKKASSRKTPAVAASVSPPTRKGKEKKQERKSRSACSSH